jgi:hypothetical protein
MEESLGVIPCSIAQYPRNYQVFRNHPTNERNQCPLPHQPHRHSYPKSLRRTVDTPELVPAGIYRNPLRMGAQNCRTPSPEPNSPCDLFSHSLPSVGMPARQTLNCQTLNRCFRGVFSSTGKRWRGGTSCCDQVRIQPTLPTAISAVIGQFFPQMLTGEVEHRNISRYYPAPVTANHNVNQMPPQTSGKKNRVATQPRRGVRGPRVGRVRNLSTRKRA